MGQARRGEVVGRGYEELGMGLGSCTATSSPPQGPEIKPAFCWGGWVGARVSWSALRLWCNGELGPPSSCPGRAPGIIEFRLGHMGTLGAWLGGDDSGVARLQGRDLASWKSRGG